MDRASEELSHIRRQRRDNMQLLRQSMAEWSRKLAAQNVSEEALVVIRRDRLCVPVKAGRQVLGLPLSRPLVLFSECVDCSCKMLSTFWVSVEKGKMAKGKLYAMCTASTPSAKVH